MECGLCRCAGPARLPVFGDFGYGKLEFSNACRGGKTAPFRDEKAISGDTECGVMMKAPPTTAFKMSQAQLLFQFLIVPLDDPALFGQAHQIG